MIGRYNKKIDRNSLLYVRLNANRVNSICRVYSDTGNLYSFLCAYLDNGETVRLTDGSVDFLDEQDGINAFFNDPEVDADFKKKFVSISQDFVVNIDNFSSVISQPCGFSRSNEVIVVRFKRGMAQRVRAVYQRDTKKTIREIQKIIMDARNSSQESVK